MTSVDKNGSVEFRFYRGDARKVELTGDFHGGSRLAMVSDSDGWWTLLLDLDPGEYRFRYVADGTWYADYASNGVEADKLGWNSVLVVPRPAQSSGTVETGARGGAVLGGTVLSGATLKVA